MEGYLHGERVTVAHRLSATFPAIVCRFKFKIIESHPTGICKDGKNSERRETLLDTSWLPSFVHFRLISYRYSLNQSNSVNYSSS